MTAMFFVFHFSILLFILISEANNFPFNSVDLINENEINENREKEIAKKEPISGSDETIFPTSKHILHIIRNFTNDKRPNLKSNVFDKMLYDEMYHIKKHFYEKDMVPASSIDITSNTNVPTPTLEVKQKWPIGLSSSLNPTKSFEGFYNESGSVSGEDNDIVLVKPSYVDAAINSPNQKKILGLRSLPETPLRLDKQCHCMRTDPSTTCTHRCTGNTAKICTHSNHEYSSKCTRKYFNHLTTCSPYSTEISSKVLPLYSMYTNLYIPYQAFYMDITTQASLHKRKHNMKHKLKLPKHRKYTSKTVSYDDYYFYDDSEYKGVGYYSANNKQSDKHYLSMSDSNKEKLGKSTNYEGVDGPDKIHQLNSADKILYTGIKTKLINNIVNDLKTYYSELIIKGCFCISNVDRMKIDTVLMVILMVLNQLC